MKTGIHPDYVDTKIVCLCGNAIETQSTAGSQIPTDICSACPPLYTGQPTIVEDPMAIAWMGGSALIAYVERPKPFGPPDLYIHSVDSYACTSCEGTEPVAVRGEDDGPSGATWWANPATWNAILSGLWGVATLLALGLTVLLFCLATPIRSQNVRNASGV